MMKKKKVFSHYKGEIHLKYPRSRVFLTWEELSCLARALGFNRYLFRKHDLHEKDKETSSGLDVQYLLYLLDIKAFHSDLHRTYNLHDAVYNMHVVKKAIDLLMNRYLSFQELREVRVAFQLYEHEDLGGMAVDEHILLRTLKMCNRTVAPIKLMQHIKHMDKLMADRLTLYEFMELLLICDRNSDVVVAPPQKAEGLDHLNLYNVCDFNAVLTTEDERKIKYMNEDYMQKMMKAPSSGNQLKSWRDIPTELVDSRPRLELVSKHKPNEIELAEHVKHSNHKVQHARCGYTGTNASSGRSFVDMNDIRQRLGQQKSAVEREFFMREKGGKRGETELERYGTEITFNVEPQERSVTLDLRGAGSARHYRAFEGTTPDRLSRGSRLSNRDILVSPRDLYCSHATQETLIWDIATQEERFFQKAKQETKSKQRHRHKTPEMSICTSENVIEDFLSESTKKLIEPYKDQEKKNNIVVSLSPRKETPSKETIYPSLMKRLQENNTLLDYGQSLSLPQTAPNFCTTTKNTPPNKPRTVPSLRITGPKVQREVVHFPDDISEEDEVERRIEYNVDDLITRLQEAKSATRENKSLNNLPHPITVK